MVGKCGGEVTIIRTEIDTSSSNTLLVIINNTK
jgi:hypothetical protein